MNSTNEITYMWQMGRGSKEYRIQTGDKTIADRIKRRNRFKLIGRGMNCRTWLFQATFNRPDIAKKILKSLTGGLLHFDKIEEVFYSESNLSNLELSRS